ncbi:LytR/AlgR family response regulator transcription factor [Sanyastnella coralliicola]|uniref:LytR/AlgR family response regulator transcription factor n=1 Tax=Sanyastnella coralliicola TaxID=3069118 RepID=UPI0027B8FDEF|nr:LytTR family DNA-binding domain-containing protein [Longitalea sp. SCSIO 12813]
MKAIIIDDEKHCSATLEYEMSRHVPDIEIIGVYNDPIEGRDALVNSDAEILFLDIEMPRLNGFELLQSIEDPKFGVIFTTAYDEFALRAFQYSAIDYLLKPVSSDDLKRAVARFQELGSARLSNAQLDILFNRLEDSGFNKIALPSSEGLDFVSPDEIMHCESQSNYTMVFFKERKKILVSRTLKEIEEMLSGHGFFRVHHSHIVNLNYVSRYVKGSGGYLVMENDVQVPVSRSRKDSLLQLFAG